MTKLNIFSNEWKDTVLKAVKEEGGFGVVPKLITILALHASKMLCRHFPYFDDGPVFVSTIFEIFCRRPSYSGAQEYE